MFWCVYNYICVCVYFLFIYFFCCIIHTGINDLLDVTEYLLNLNQTDIYFLGLTLGLTHPHLKNMENSKTFREDMIAAWLQKEDEVTRRGLPTWETLVKALRNNRVKQNGVADKIAIDKNVLKELRS